jgi:hypothetical protein
MSGSNGFSSIQLATAAIKTGDITAPHAHLFRIARGKFLIASGIAGVKR